MSLLRPISIFLRNFLIRQHPYFSCCASCGEIKTPLGNRLCTSLAAEFPIDAVFLNWQGNNEDILRLSALAEANFPWLGTLFLVAAASAAGDSGGPRVRLVPPESLPQPGNLPGDPAGPLPPEALLHNLPDLAEYYLVFRDSRFPRGNMTALDFYTPNGLPLIPQAILSEGVGRALEADDPVRALLESSLDSSRRPQAFTPAMICPQSKQLAAGFLPFFTEFARRAGDAAEQRYAPLFAQWLCVTGQGVPVPNLMQA